MKATIILLITLAGALCVGVVVSDPAHFDASGERSARIVFAGDMMFDRTIRAKAEGEHSAAFPGYSYPLSCATAYLKTFDLAVANLEGPITDGPSTSLGTLPGEPGNTNFTFAPDVAASLFDSNIRMLSLGNNHSLDKGWPGADSTRKYLSDVGARFFGSPGESLVATTTIHGLKLAFVSFNQFLGLGDANATVRAIESARSQADFVFVYTHWGDEYVPANDMQKALARRFVDAGADMVVGSHPHVIQESEVYAGKHIYYSLGNFIFDQYWTEEVRTGLLLEVSLSNKGILVTERKANLSRDGRTCIAGEAM